MFNLSGKVAFITGAQRGMGEAHAHALAAQGAKVALTDLGDGCETVAADVRARGQEAASWSMDVSKKAEIEKVFDDVEKRFGRLDILVNNAGIFLPKAALELTEEEWDATLSVNLKGQFLCAQRAAAAMKKGGGGRIINIASIASGGVGTGFVGGAHYSASKGGIVALTETLALEWAPLGITVNCIAPGAIDTPMLHPSGTPISDEVRTLLKERVPLGRMGTPQEVSAAVVFLASDEASYVTGSTLYVDGGWLAM